jgi:hypothetical protein
MGPQLVHVLLRYLGWCRMSKTRYRWACVAGMWRWWNAEQLASTPDPLPAVIRLHWREVSDTLLEAVHEGWRFAIYKRPNWDKHPQLNYSYVTSVWRARRGDDTVSDKTDLGTHADSNIARQKCANFINAKTTEGVST